MICEKTKTIKFGYGTIAVSSYVYPAALVIDYIEPPTDIGGSINLETKFLGRLEFKRSKALKEFLEKLKDVTAENPFVTLDEYTFDFSNFNPKSVEVVIDATRRAITGPQIALAA